MWFSGVGCIATLILSLLVVQLVAAATQPPQKVPRVGYLNPGSSSDPHRQRRLEALRQGLRELGYVEGQNIAIESRWAEGKYDRYPALAADLVRVQVDVIVAMGGGATKAAQEATRTIPIVMSVVQDPIGSGLVASLARPGGNVTGISAMAPDLVGKQLQLLKEVVPKVSLVALLWNPDNPGSAAQLREAEAAARALGVRLQTLEARVPQEIDSAFAAMTRERAGALLILLDAVFGSQQRQIAELAAQRRLPSIFGGGAVRGGRRAHGLWPKPSRLGTARGHLRAQDPERCQARGPAGGAAHQVRAGHQPQDRQGPGDHYPPNAPVSGGRGDQIGRSRSVYRVCGTNI